ncbi:MAG TPA: DUF952 domain-containing protein [Acidimicrobiales bacterium]|nr:DUF952 domain-containing protein [Acidimicrobiales bacterium]
MSPALVYKILRPSEWAEFETTGAFDGSPDDLRDGFIHCSSRTQLAATAHRIFANDPQLVIVSLHADPLHDALRWEPSRDGDLFPHVYGPLSRDAVASVYHVSGADAIEATVPL